MSAIIECKRVDNENTLDRRTHCSFLLLCIVLSVITGCSSHDYACSRQDAVEARAKATQILIEPVDADSELAYKRADERARHYEQHTMYDPRSLTTDHDPVAEFVAQLFIHVLATIIAHEIIGDDHDAHHTHRISSPVIPQPRPLPPAPHNFVPLKLN